MTALRVLTPGPQLLVEDQGRPGWAHLGVPPSGALDPAALRLANRLVGNPETAAGLEVLLGGAVLEAVGSLRLALTGAHLELRIDGRAAPWGQPLSVRAGSTIEVGPAAAGLRGWLALAGGIAVPPQLASLSTDTLTGLGPAPLRAGDLLRLGPAQNAVVDAAAVAASATGGAGAASQGVVLRLTLGPRDAMFTAAALERLVREVYVVQPDSNRVAMRLQSRVDALLTRSVSGELPSEGLVTGAVQVPTDGRPLIFLADHPVTGGYPVIGVLDEVSTAACAQFRPGDRVRFHVR